MPSANRRALPSRGKKRLGATVVRKTKKLSAKPKRRDKMKVNSLTPVERNKARAPKSERIRDPLHNLIEFGTDQFEHVIWQITQTRPFQRLRRIKQLGFSELVYPGAAHTRFAHSIGVFHTARHLMRIIEKHIRSRGLQYREHQAQVALAAAMVHDIGHGMFSHAFEEIGKKLGLTMARHEHVSDMLIRQNDEIGQIFREMGSGFASDVADVLRRGRPGNLYDSVVSSQFDADRLDYMQRDRLMTGLQNSSIDFTWLMANLEIGSIKTGVDEEEIGEVDTFILGPKAYHAAETYVLSLFQLYPTVYLHKTTRAAEKLFTVLILRLVELVRAGQSDKTGLPANHPFIKFAKNSDSLDCALCLDDSVFWGSLSLFADAKDKAIRDCAIALRDRNLPKCVDVRMILTNALGIGVRDLSEQDRAGLKRKLDRLIANIEKRIQFWSEENSDGMPRILTDRASRDPYKRFQESKGPLNQIHIRMPSGDIRDVAECSPVIAAIESFELYRAYAYDAEARGQIEQITEDELGKADA